MKKFIVILACLLAVFPCIGDAAAVSSGAIAAVVASSAASNAARMMYEREAQENSGESYNADGVVICSSYTGENCDLGGGCERSELVSFDNYLAVKKGSGYKRIGIAYNNYDHQMKIYYVKDQ